MDVKAHLEQLGFEAKGEVLGCDVVAVRAGDAPCLVIARGDPQCSASSAEGLEKPLWW
jgi:hypothetical protein